MSRAAHISCAPITSLARRTPHRPSNRPTSTLSLLHDRSATLFSTHSLAHILNTTPHSLPPISSSPSPPPYLPPPSYKPLTLLRQKQSIALLNRHPMPRVLVVRGETGRMRALADFAVDDFLERVDALGRVERVGDEHEMHAVGGLVCVGGRVLSGGWAYVKVWWGVGI